MSGFSNSHGKIAKNYHLPDKFGWNRNEVEPYVDPNPNKWGGTYGLISLKDRIDSKYQKWAKEK